MIKLSSILIGVSDLTKSREFFENVFEMTFDEFRPPFASANLDGVEFNLEENTSEREESWAKNHIGNRKQFSFEVHDIESFLEKAVSFGAKVVSPVKERPWRWKELVIADRDGNEFLIEQKI